MSLRNEIVAFATSAVILLCPLLYGVVAGVVLEGLSVLQDADAWTADLLLPT